MVRGYNKVILVGNLTRDPELRYTPNGTPVATLGIASNRTWRGDDGEQKEDVYFARVIVWRRQAETCDQYLKKGSGVLVEGRLKENKYTDRENVERRVTEIVAERVTFLARGQRDPDAVSQDAGPPMDDDDLPFE
ncbi:MAG: single-stranded DNA-binding protein [bacterium]|nr:single-stranded DNA-binding protein [bacterium]